MVLLCMRLPGSSMMPCCDTRNKQIIRYLRIGCFYCNAISSVPHKSFHLSNTSNRKFNISISWSTMPHRPWPDPLNSSHSNYKTSTNNYNLRIRIWLHFRIKHTQVCSIIKLWLLRIKNWDKQVGRLIWIMWTSSVSLWTWGWQIHGSKR